jgi:hypothetical protein
MFLSGIPNALCHGFRFHHHPATAAIRAVVYGVVPVFGKANCITQILAESSRLKGKRRINIACLSALSFELSFLQPFWKVHPQDLVS